ncbi:MAG: hypothetical protein XD98_0407 [Microgenomates bacterium 39_6]|nr:MAG: hypothetical protein XD98_0407 [Microgenomates bacterium 39_6]
MVAPATPKEDCLNITTENQNIPNTQNHSNWFIVKSLKLLRRPEKEKGFLKVVKAENLLKKY